MSSDEKKKKKKSKVLGSEKILNLEKELKKKEKLKKERKKSKEPGRRPGRPKGSKTQNREPLDVEGYSALSNDAQKIWDMLEAKENDNAITLTQKAMLQTVIKMMPEAEKRYFESKSAHQAVYAFNALVTSARELIADVQASEDKSRVADKIIHELLQPHILAFANFLLESSFYLSKHLKKLVKESKHRELQKIIDEDTRSKGNYAQEMFKSFKEQLPKVLE